MTGSCSPVRAREILCICTRKAAPPRKSTRKKGDKEPVSYFLFHPSFFKPPPVKHKTNIDLPLILDKIPLPSKLLLRSKSYLSNLYASKNLPMREIARQLNVSHSTVIEAFKRLGIQKGYLKNSKKIQGRIPFDYNYKNGRLEKSEEEQEVIGTIKQLRSNGLSLRGIARELNHRLIPTKNNGIWHANTVSIILERGGNQKMM